MFSRSTSFLLNPIKSELCKTGVRYSSISKKKRIPVQLLKDFTGIGIKGQIVQVKPSTMMNKLHRYNGAVYLNVEGSEPVIPVVKVDETLQAQIKEQAKQLASSAAAASETSQGKLDVLFTLDELSAFDLNTSLGADRDIIISKIPRRIQFSNDAFKSKLTRPVLKARIQSVLTKMVIKDLKEGETESSVNEFFSPGSTVLRIMDPNGGEEIEVIEKLGDYDIVLCDVKDGLKELHALTLTVKPSGDNKNKD